MTAAGLLLAVAVAAALVARELVGADERPIASRVAGALLVAFLAVLAVRVVELAT